MTAPINPADKHPCATRCGACGHIQIVAWTPMDARIFTKLLKSQLCRWCGNGPKNMWLATDAEAHLCGRPVFAATEIPHPLTASTT